MVERTLALCRAMGAGEEQQELLLPLVQAAVDGLAARLKEGLSPEDCGPAFPLAAAMAAMEGLEQAAGSAGSVSSFTAGNLTIRTGASAGARGLAARGEGLLAPYLRDRGFFFRGVRG